ncbi:MAG: oligosaccharide flippase family protein [Solirubrobacterales bacterium]|nr:oligosaccharide flippase family protein [Solirubrobacterales bacterium]
MSDAPENDTESSTRAYGKSVGLLTIGVGLTGIFTYAYFLIASHDLDENAYGEIAFLWSAVFITVSTLYRPIDQLLSRHISEHIERGETDVGPVRVAAKIQGCLALGFAVIALILKQPLENLLYGNSTLYWVFFSAVLFYAASYYARGYLAGHQQFGLFTTLILSESVFRTLFAALVAFGLLSGQSMVAIGIVAAPLLSLMVVPIAITRRSRREAEERAAYATAHGEAEENVDAEEKEAREEFSLAHGAGFVGSVFLIMFSEQVFLNAGPLVIGIVKGSAATGFIFNVLMIARAPLQLFQAVSTSILPHLTALHSSDDPDSERQFHRSVRMVLLGILAFTALTAVVVMIAGPKLMQIAFGADHTYDRLGLMLVTAGMGLYLSTVTVNQACVAQGQARRSSIRWISCAAFFIVWTVLPFIGDGNLRVELGFALTALLLLSLLTYIYLRPKGIDEDIPREGSSEAIEARLAGYEEGNL